MLQHRKSEQKSSLPLLCLTLCSIYLAGCGPAMAQRTEEVVVAPIGDEGEVTVASMTREELEDQVRRFADRYFTRVTLAANKVREQTTTSEQYLLMQQWKSISFATIVQIAIGQNAVTNLLDMMVLTTLSRVLVEEYWVPEVIGESIGQDFISAYRILEKDIWTVADAVLTTDQQDDLRILISEWRTANPDQIYPWYVRLSEFSGQRAARLNSLKQSGGLLKEVAKAREAAEEMQEFGERVLFYLQRAPALTSMEMENSFLEVLGGPEMSLILDDVDRFVVAVEELVAVIDELPGDRLAAVDQLMERISEERRALIQDLSTTGPDVSEALNELRQSVEAFERIVNTLNQGEAASEPFDIDKYQAVAAEAGKTASELRLLAEALSDTLDNSSNLVSLIDTLAETQTNLMNRLFLLAVALIFIFFAVLLVYRHLAKRLVAP
jgi:hypothetical protein